jgi:hypothetical protein
MATKTPSRGGLFTEVGWAFLDLLICYGVFLAFRRAMLKKVLRDVAS